MFKRPHPQADWELWFKEAMLDRCPPDNTAYFCNLDETEDVNGQVCMECWLNYVRCLNDKGIRYFDVHRSFHTVATELF